MAEKIDIVSLGIDQAELEASNAKLIGQIATLKESMKDLRKETGNLTSASSGQSEQYVKQDAELKKLNTEYNKQKAILAESTTSVKGLADALEKEVQSLGAAKKNNKELIAAREGINGKTKEGQKAIEQINEKLDKNNGYIKENVSGLEKQKIGIGAYEEGVTSALAKVEIFGINLGEASQKGLAFARSQKEAALATEGNSRSLKILRAALISTGIGAVVIAVVALASAFASTQGGMDKINETLAPIKGGFESIIGIVQDISVNVFSQLADRWTVAKNSILSGVNQIRLAWNKLSGDVEETKELQAYQDKLDNEVTAAQERLNEKTAALAAIWDGASDRIKEGAKNYQAVERLTVAIEERQIELVRKQGELNRQYEQSKEILENINLTAEQREAAARKALEAQNELERLSIGLSDLKIKRKELENSFNDTSRADLLELAELEAERENAAADAAGKRTSVANQLRALEKQVITEQNAAVKAALDEDIRLRQENLAKRKALDDEFEQAKKLARSIKFEEEILALEEQGASEIALEVAKIDQRTELRKAEAIAQIEDKTLLERQLQVIEDQAQKAKDQANEIALSNGSQRYQQFYGNVATLVGKNSEVGKAAAVAQTTIATFTGAREAFKALAGITGIGPALGIAAAAAATAAGLADVKRITSVKNPKAERGALIKLGGQRHSSGGNTIFDQSGNPLVNAEEGEVLGVMNRNAARLFMDFNNQYRDGSYSNPFGQFAMSGRSGGSLPAMTDKRINRRLESLERTIANKKEVKVVVDKDGFETSISDGFQKEVYLNKKFNG